MEMVVGPLLLDMVYVTERIELLPYDGILTSE